MARFSGWPRERTRNPSIPTPFCHKAILPIPQFNGMLYASLHVLAASCTPINGGGVLFDPLSLALVVLIFNHCAHVLLGTCGGLKGVGSYWAKPTVTCIGGLVFFPRAVVHTVNACIVTCTVWWRWWW